MNVTLAAPKDLGPRDSTRHVGPGSSVLEQLRHSRRGQTGLKGKNLRALIDRTAPPGIELHRSDLFKISADQPGKRFAVVRAHVPVEAENAVRQWRKEFQDTTGVHLLLHRSQAYSSVRNELKSLVGGRKFIGNSEVEILRKELSRMTSREPKLADLPEPKVSTNLVDYTRLPAIAMDPDGAQAEDAIWATRRSDGSYHLIVFIVDVTDYIRPGSPFDRNACEVGATIYSRKRSLSTIGREAASTIGCFKEGDVSTCWAMEFFIGPDGSFANDGIPTINRGKMKVARALTIDQTNLLLVSEADPRLTAIKEVVNILKATRSDADDIFRDIHRKTPADLLVMEVMLAYQAGLGKFLDKHNIPAPFRVHTKSDPKALEWLSQQLAEFGIYVTPEALAQEEKTFEILDALDLLGSDKANDLYNRMLDIFLHRGYFSEVNFGHDDLKVKFNAKLKPRDLMGLTVGWQIRSFFDGEPLMSNEEIRVRASIRNKTEASSAVTGFKISLYDDLIDALPQEGRKIRAWIEDVSDDRVTLTVPRFAEFHNLNVVLRGPYPPDLNGWVDIRVGKYDLDEMTMNVRLEPPQKPVRTPKFRHRSARRNKTGGN